MSDLVPPSVCTMTAFISKVLDIQLILLLLQMYYNALTAFINKAQ